MSVIECKICGGDLVLSDDRTYGICEYCGSTMTLPRVDGEQTAAAFNRGNHFRRIGEFDKALEIYERIVEQNDSNAEAHWCCALCRYGIEYVEDPETREWIPTCHRASFDSILEDVDYLAALEYSDGVTRKQYERDGAKIARVQKAVLTVSQHEEPFDIFLCYKETEEDGSRTQDSALAQDIYYQLTDQGRRVFFARITLEDKGGVEYEPYIFAALHSAKVMVVVGTSAAHLNAVWVKNEWSRFLALMKQDRSKLLLPCYRDMNPYDLPEQLSILQSYDMSKIGFIQDLVRGINKVLDGGKEPEPKATVKETVIVQGKTGNLEALLQRGDIALEDREWKKADGFYEQALNLDADEPRAYLGKFLSEQKQPTLEKLAEARTALHTVEPHVLEACPEDAETIKRIRREHTLENYYTPADALFSFDRSYPAGAAQWRELYTKEAAFWSGNKLYQRALEFSVGELRERLKEASDRLLNSLKQKQEEAVTGDAAECERVCAAYREHLQKAEKEAARKLEEAKRKQEQDLKEKERQRQEIYEAACREQESAVEFSEFETAKKMFAGLGDYRDSLAHVQACAREIEALQEAKKIVYEQQKELLRKKRKVRTLIVSACVLAAAALAALTILIIIPGVRYSSAEKLMENGEYKKAISAFSELGNFRDAQDRTKEAKAAMLEQENAANYAQAEKLFQDGEYMKAAALFKKLGEFQDASEKYQEAELARQDEKKAKDYAQAENLEKTGEYLGAREIFNALPDYRDASDRAAALTEKIYNKAESLALAEDTRSEAMMLYGAIPEYLDAQLRSFDLWNKSLFSTVVAGGLGHYVCIMDDGTVFTDGINEYGECDTSDWSDIVEVEAGKRHTVGLKKDSTVVATGSAAYGRCDVEGWNDIVSIAAGGYHTVGLKMDGTVVAVGWNENGQCDVSEWTNIVAVTAGDKYTLGLKADGTVIAAGDNSSGQCNVSGWKDIVGISAGDFHAVGLKIDGTVVSVGRNNENQCNITDWSNIQAVSAGSHHTVGLKSDGTVVAAGFNTDKQCEVSKWKDIAIIDASGSFTIGITNNKENENKVTGAFY